MNARSGISLNRAKASEKALIRLDNPEARQAASDRLKQAGAPDCGATEAGAAACPNRFGAAAPFDGAGPRP